MSSVSDLIRHGWSSLCDGHVAVSWFRCELRPGRGPHRQLDIRAGDRLIEVTVSPTGRSVRIYVDGVEVQP